MEVGGDKQRCGMEKPYASKLNPQDTAGSKIWINLIPAIMNFWFPSVPFCQVFQWWVVTLSSSLSFLYSWHFIIFLLPSFFHDGIIGGHNDATSDEREARGERNNITITNFKLQFGRI